MYIDKCKTLLCAKEKMGQRREKGNFGSECHFRSTGQMSLPLHIVVSWILIDFQACFERSQTDTHCFIYSISYKPPRDPATQVR